MSKMSKKIGIGSTLVVGAIISAASSAVAWNPQPDPPRLGLLSIIEGQGARLNVVCDDINVNGWPPDPCHGTLFFHDPAGNVLESHEYQLPPGRSAFLTVGFTAPGVDVSFTENSRMGIVPSILPASDNQGRAIPTVEVFDLSTGKTELFVNPAAPRLSDIQSGPGLGSRLLAPR